MRPVGGVPLLCFCAVQEEVRTTWARRVDILPKYLLSAAWDAACFQPGRQKYMAELPLN